MNFSCQTTLNRESCLRGSGQGWEKKSFLRGCSNSVRTLKGPRLVSENLIEQEVRRFASHPPPPGGNTTTSSPSDSSVSNILKCRMFLPFTSMMKSSGFWFTTISLRSGNLCNTSLRVALLRSKFTTFSLHPSFSLRKEKMDTLTFITEVVGFPRRAFPQAI